MGSEGLRRAKTKAISRRRFLGTGFGVAAGAATVENFSDVADAGASTFHDLVLSPRVTSDTPSLAYVLRRREDQLWLRFDFYNLALDGSQRLTVVDPALDAVMVIGFPTQTVFEEPVLESSIFTYQAPFLWFPGSWKLQPVSGLPKDALAGLGALPIQRQSDATPNQLLKFDWSRLAFTIPPSALPLVLSDDLLLDWALRAKNLGLQPRLVAAATESGPQPAPHLARKQPTRLQALIKRVVGTREPNLIIGVPASAPENTMTALELPWWILVSPNQWAAWKVSPQPSPENSHTEMWHVRLAVLDPTPGNPPINSQTSAGRTIRAVWSRDDSSTAIDPFGSGPEVLTAQNRKSIVANSAVPSLVLAQATAPIAVNNLMLSPLGGWLDVEGNWPNAPQLTSWRHRSTMGRDHYVKTAIKGYLMPFGHQCVKVTISERQVLPSTQSGRPVAVLVQRTYLDITEPVRAISSADPKQQRRMPLTSVELLTKQTPDLQAPLKPAYVPSSTADFPFHARLLSGDLFEFKARGTDLAGVTHDFSMPMAFVPAATTGTLLVNFLQSTYGFRTKDLPADPKDAFRVAPVKLSQTSMPLKGTPLPFFGGHDPSQWSDTSKVRAVSLRGARFKVMTEPPGTPSTHPASSAAAPDNTALPLRMMVLDFDWSSVKQVANTMNLAAGAAIRPGVASANQVGTASTTPTDLVQSFVNSVIPGIRYFTTELDSLGAVAGADAVVGAFQYVDTYLEQAFGKGETFCGTFATAVVDAPNLLVPLLQTGAANLLDQPEVTAIIGTVTEFGNSLGDSILKAAGDRLGGFAAPNSVIVALSSVLGPVQGSVSPLQYIKDMKSLYDSVQAWEKDVVSNPVAWATTGFNMPTIPPSLVGPLNSVGSYVASLLPTFGSPGTASANLLKSFEQLGQAAVTKVENLEQLAASYLSDGLSTAERYGKDLSEYGASVLSQVNHLLSGSILGGPSINDLIADTKHVISGAESAIANLLPKGMTIERVQDNSLDALAKALTTSLQGAQQNAQSLTGDEQRAHMLLEKIKAGGQPDAQALKDLQANVKGSSSNLKNLTKDAVAAIEGFSLADALKVHYRVTWVPTVPLVYDDDETKKTDGTKPTLSATSKHLPFVTYLDQTSSEATHWDGKAESRTSFKLRADSVLSLTDPSSSTYETRAEITNLTLRIPTADTELLRVPVKSFVFTAGKGKQAHFDPSLGSIQLLRELKFVEELASLAKSNGFSVKVGTTGVVAAFATDIPSVSVGVFALSNMSFGANATIPFDGTPARVGLNFCTKEKPFALAIYTFAGGGYFSLSASFRGIENFDACFEFGAQAAFDIAGIVKGSIYVKGGIHYSYDLVNKSVFHAFIHLGGSAKIMAIASASIDLSLDLGYETVTNKWTGTAVLSVSVSVLFFSFSDSFEVHRSIGGNDPTFADEYTTPALYSAYCGAFG